MSDCSFYSGFTTFGDLEKQVGIEYAKSLYANRYGEGYDPDMIAGFGSVKRPTNYENCTNEYHDNKLGYRS